MKDEFDMFHKLVMQVYRKSLINGYPLNTTQYNCQSSEQNLGSTPALGLNSHIDHQLICRKPNVVE